MTLISLNFTALCPDPTAPVNGAVTTTGNSALSGDTANYTCDDGFELSGTPVANCTQTGEDNATFEPIAPICNRKFENKL